MANVEPFRATRRLPGNDSRVMDSRLGVSLIHASLTRGSRQYYKAKIEGGAHEPHTG
jgi:hypothetical protein